MGPWPEHLRRRAPVEHACAISVIDTAVTLFPVIKRRNEAVALGYVAGRVVEAVVIVVGVISLLSVVTLRQDFARAPEAPARNATGGHPADGLDAALAAG